MPTLNPALREFWETPARNRVLYGGRASSKTWDAGGAMVYSAQAKPIKIMCVRQFQNRIEDSVYTVLKSAIKRFGFSNHFKILSDKIRGHNGSEFIFYGLWRHVEEIKSTEGVDILWVEEGHSLTKEQWAILEPTIRKEGSVVLIVFNPRLATDFAYQRFVVNPPPNTVVRKINYDENPFLSQTMRDIIAAAKAEDEDEYRHIYLGEPREDDDQVIIKRSWLMACVDAHKKLGIEPVGDRRVGFDVADSGDDKNALAAMHGGALDELEEWKGREDELLQSAGRVHHTAVRLGADIGYDSIGIGAFAGSHFAALNDDPDVTGEATYYRFNAGGAVINPDAQVNPDEVAQPGEPKPLTNRDAYANIKAQSWWEFARRALVTFNAVTKGMDYDPADILSFSSDLELLDRLITELSTPRKAYDRVGRSMVESKKDLAKRDVPSPNLADAVIIAAAPREAVAAPVGMFMSSRARSH